jgi:fructosamine-3-kinase
MTSFMLLKVDQMFEAEALGLGAMYETETIHVSKLYKVRRFNSP